MHAGKDINISTNTKVIGYDKQLAGCYKTLAFGIIVEAIRDYQSKGGLEPLIKQKRELERKLSATKNKQRRKSLKMNIYGVDNSIQRKLNCVEWLRGEVAGFYCQMLGIKQAWLIDNIDIINAGNIWIIDDRLRGTDES